MHDKEQTQEVLLGLPDYCLTGESTVKADSSRRINGVCIRGSRRNAADLLIPHGKSFGQSSVKASLSRGSNMKDVF